MNFLKKIKGGILGGIIFVIVLLITKAAYGAYVSLSDVNSGDTLTSSLFNQVLENQRAIKTSVDISRPVGSVMAFNLSTCPTGWIPANGTNSTPDLRGEFIRGLDNGRGVDSGRTLSSLQRGSLVMNAISNTQTRVFSMSYENDERFSYDSPLTDSTKLYYYGKYEGAGYHTWGTNGFVDANYVKMTRPRNVALLYCVKQ